MNLAPHPLRLARRLVACSVRRRIGAVAFALLGCVSACAKPDSVLATGREAENQIDWQRLYQVVHRGDFHSVEGYPAQHQATLVIGDVSRVSGLPIVQPVMTKVVTRDEMAEMMNTPPPYTAELMAAWLAYVDVVEALGFAGDEPPAPREGAASYARPTLQAMRAGPTRGAHCLASQPRARSLRPSSALGTVMVSGLYVPSEQAFYVADDVPTDWRGHTVRHELMHALQDQRLKLDPLIASHVHDVDEFIAVKSMIEGQAEMAAVLAGALRPGAAVAPPVAELERDEAAQRVLDAQREGERAPDDELSSGFEETFVLFPYTAGAAFIGSLFEATGADEFPHVVETTLTRPPLSTRELLHPNLYVEALRGYRPTPPVLSSLATDAYTLTAESGLGEFTLRYYLYAHSEDYQLADAFVVDRFARLEHADPSVPAASVWVSRWHDEASAQKFVDAARRAQQKLDANPGAGESSPKFASEAAAPRARTRSFVSRRGATVGVALHLPHEGDAAVDVSTMPPAGSDACTLIEHLLQVLEQT